MRAGTKRTIDQFFSKNPAPKKLAIVSDTGAAPQNDPGYISVPVAATATAGTANDGTVVVTAAAQATAQPSAAAAASTSEPAPVTVAASAIIITPPSSQPAPYAAPMPSGILMDLLQEPSWKTALAAEFQKPYFRPLQKFVVDELASGKAQVYPPKEHIFRAFNTCPFDQVKVVILGQDPYHGPGQAMGLSFSVPPGVKQPSSLQNIFKELQADLGCKVPNHGSLEKWASQGVLLLNAMLTVRAGVAGSHQRKGWEQLTDAAIKALASKRSNIVFMLWGNFAISKEVLVPANKHLVLKCAHPSGLSAHRGYFGCKHFSKANSYLVSSSQQPIDWCIPNV